MAKVPPNIQVLLGKSKIKLLNGELIRKLDAQDDDDYSEFFVESSDPQVPPWSEDVEPTFIEADPDALSHDAILEKLSGGQILTKFKEFQIALSKAKGGGL